MKIVIDSNILFAALLKPGLTYNLLFGDAQYYFPSHSLHELEKYKPYFCKKLQISERDLELVIKKTLKRIVLVPRYKVEPRLPEAELVMRNIDIDDALFIACALAVGAHYIWSEDNHLKKQDVISVVNTKELLQLSK